MSVHPRTISDIVENYRQRKDGLRKALTVDVEAFFSQCQPDKENLCLYGEPDGTWLVDLPAEEVPAELPEPCLGINFARDGMTRKDWLALIAVHSDAWLLSVAFYYGAKLNADQRKQLFAQLNSEPTLYEEVTGKQRPAQGVGVKRSRESPKRRLAKESDISNSLKGKRAELYWPDDAKWYAVEIQAVTVKRKLATIQYDTGETEELNLQDIIKDEQMYLLD